MLYKITYPINHFKCLPLIILSVPTNCSPNIVNGYTHLIYHVTVISCYIPYCISYHIPLYPFSPLNKNKAGKGPLALQPDCCFPGWVLDASVDFPVAKLFKNNTLFLIPNLINK